MGIWSSRFAEVRILWYNDTLYDVSLVYCGITQMMMVIRNKLLMVLYISDCIVYCIMMIYCVGFMKSFKRFNIVLRSQINRKYDGHLGGFADSRRKIFLTTGELLYERKNYLKMKETHKMQTQKNLLEMMKNCFKQEDIILDSIRGDLKSIWTF